MSNPLTSEYHPHPFRTYSKEELWICDGRSLFGDCKSDIKDFTLHKGIARFRCTICDDFDLCSRCLTESKVPDPKGIINESDSNEPLKTFTTKDHPHPFVLYKTDAKWKCDGDSIYNTCKLGIEKFGINKGIARYRCTVCDDFDICSGCLKASESFKPTKPFPSDSFEVPHDLTPIKDQTNYTCKNHLHPFKLETNGTSWKCDGDSINGACKLGVSDFGVNIGIERYKCTICDDFDLCSGCLNAPEPNDSIEPIPSDSNNLPNESTIYEDKEMYTSKYHTHPFIKEYFNGEFKCDGAKLTGKCKTNEEGNYSDKKRYKCSVCQNLYICDSCMKKTYRIV